MVGHLLSIYIVSMSYRTPVYMHFGDIDPFGSLIKAMEYVAFLSWLHLQPDKRISNLPTFSAGHRLSEAMDYSLSTMPALGEGELKAFSGKTRITQNSPVKLMRLIIPQWSLASSCIWVHPGARRSPLRCSKWDLSHSHRPLKVIWCLWRDKSNGHSCLSCSSHLRTLFGKVHIRSQCQTN